MNDARPIRNHPPAKPEALPLDVIRRRTRMDEGLASRIDEKVIAGAITAAIAPVVIGFVAKWTGANIDIPTATAIVGAVVLGAVTLVAGYLKKSRRFEELKAIVEEDGG